MAEVESNRGYRFEEFANNNKDTIKILSSNIGNDERSDGDGDITAVGTNRAPFSSSTINSVEDITLANEIVADFTYNVLVVLIQWKNHQQRNRPLIEPNAIEEMWNGVGVGDNYKSGSMSNWTAVNSHQKWKVHATVISEWITMPETERYYANGNSAYPTFNEESLDPFEEGIQYALEQVTSRNLVANWNQFDHDNDGVLDTVMFIHSGYDAGNGLGDCTDGSYQPSDMIHSLARNGYAIDWTSGAHILGNYAVDAAYVGNCDFTINRIGIPMHEFMHTVGLPDLYDLGGRFDQDSQYVSGIGAYDIMYVHINFVRRFCAMM